jgi:hypothetical protein
MWEEQLRMGHCCKLREKLLHDVVRRTLVKMKPPGNYYDLEHLKEQLAKNHSGWYAGRCRQACA